MRGSRSKRKTEPITLWRPQTEVDDGGTPVEQEPLRLLDCFASIDTASGGETTRGRQVDATASHIVTIWAVEGLRATDYVMWNGRRLNIVAILDRSGRGVEYDVLAKEQA